MDREEPSTVDRPAVLAEDGDRAMETIAAPDAARQAVVDPVADRVAREEEDHR